VPGIIKRSRDGLTLWKSLAYRWPVTCRWRRVEPCSRTPLLRGRASSGFARRGAADHAEGP
jgi:hypothetical protein